MDTLGLGRIVIVDDDEDMRFIVSNALSAEGFEVVQFAEDSPQIHSLDQEKPDLIVLDIEMGRVNGFVILEELRKHSQLPVILLTSRGEEDDRVRGLDLGADDYIVKPFLPKELASRIRAVLRRSLKSVKTPVHLSYGPLTIDAHNRTAMVADRPVSLTRLEFNVLYTLAASPGEAYSRARLLEEVWHSEPQWQDPETVTEHVRRLRSKLAVLMDVDKHIITVRGVGYRFDP